MNDHENRRAGGMPVAAMDELRRQRERRLVLDGKARLALPPLACNECGYQLVNHLFVDLDALCGELMCAHCASRPTRRWIAAVMAEDAHMTPDGKALSRAAAVDLLLRHGATLTDQPTGPGRLDLSPATEPTIVQIPVRDDDSAPTEPLPWSPWWYRLRYALLAGLMVYVALATELLAELTGAL